MKRRKKAHEQDGVKEVIENRLWKGISREDLKLCLEARRFGRQAISPGMLLLQLQFGAMERDAIIDAIMEFDDDEIETAIGALLDKGLY